MSADPPTILDATGQVQQSAAVDTGFDLKASMFSSRFGT